MEIFVDDLMGEAIARFLDEYLEDMRSISPPALILYLKHGFVYCLPFSAYVEDPNSVFMTLDLG